MKKIICLFVAVLLLFSIAMPTNTVFAASLSDSLIMRLTETHTESQIDINVKLVKNTGVSGMTLELFYNKDVLEYSGYERGTALDSLDLISTNLDNNSTLPIKFNWYSQNVENDFSTGNILKLHFTLRPDAPSGEYEIGFKFNDGDIMYIENSNTNTKSAIIDKAVVNIADNKISDTEIVEDSKGGMSAILIIGIVAVAVSAVVATIVVIFKIKKEKARKKNWLEI